MNRRNWIKNSAKSAVAYLALPRALRAAETVDGLKGAAGRCGCRTGVWIDRWMLSDRALTAQILSNFNQATIGSIKWDFLQKTRDSLDFKLTDLLVAFCVQNRMRMHGHNLCWNATNPSWLETALTPGNARQMLTTYITEVMTRYKGKITSYDVVNEPIATWKGRPDGLYTGPWLTALGSEYIDIAFDAARAADPNALRVLNTAHVEQDGKGDDAARDKTLDLVRSLVKRGVPIDAVGLESHLYATANSGLNSNRDAFVAGIRELGLKILITELDVNDSQLAGPIETRDKAVADCYQKYLESMIPTAAPAAVTFFCFTDAKNWYDAMKGPQFTRADGTQHRPGLLDAQYQPKPAYESAMLALRSACHS